MFKNKPVDLLGCALFWLIPISAGLAVLIADTPLGRVLYPPIMALFPGNRLIPVLCVGALPMLAFYLARRFSTPKYVRVLRDPASIVWVYIMSQNGAKSFIVGTTSGSRVELGVAEIDRLGSVLQLWIPHATFGYSNESDAQFRRDPNSLRRA